MDRQLPSVEIHHINLVGDPRKSVFHGPFIATYIKWPSLGVSIMHSLQRAGEAK